MYAVCIPNAKLECGTINLEGGERKGDVFFMASHPTKKPQKHTWISVLAESFDAIEFNSTSGHW